MAAHWVPIEYREFYDVPRCVLVRNEDQIYYFESPFDEELDDYAPEFTVYQLPQATSGEAFAGSWDVLTLLGRPLGKIDVAAVPFDRTKRKAIDWSALDGLLAGRGVKSRAS